MILVRGYRLQCGARGRTRPNPDPLSPQLPVRPGQVPPRAVPAPDHPSSRPATVSSPTAEAILRSRPGAQERLRCYGWVAMVTGPWPAAGRRLGDGVGDEGEAPARGGPRGRVGRPQAAGQPARAMQGRTKQLSEQRSTTPRGGGGGGGGAAVLLYHASHAAAAARAARRWATQM
eukprot:SAG25_NODE_525_length_7195_cov_273.318207_6_plen_175_part_00